MTSLAPYCDLCHWVFKRSAVRSGGPCPLAGCSGSVVVPIDPEAQRAKERSIEADRRFQALVAAGDPLAVALVEKRPSREINEIVQREREAGRIAKKGAGSGRT